MANLNPNDIRVNNGTGIFRLIKDQKSYTSYWVCTGGQCPGTFGHNSSGMIVPVAFRSDLYKLARDAGYTSDDLAAPKRPEKVKATGRTRSVVTKKAGIRISLRDRLKGRVKIAPATSEDN